MVEHRWARPQWHSTIDSTHRVLLADPVPGAVVVADYQSAGQGRRGRVWSAPPGTSLAVSVAVPSVRSDWIGWVPLLAGLAVSRAVNQCGYGVRARLKWPNDVLVTGPGESEPRKVCGVLAAARPGVVVIGAGLNIDQRREQLPTAAATSWALAAGIALPHEIRFRWLNAYLDHLARLLDDLADGVQMRLSYREACSTIGQQVRIDLSGGRTISGGAVDIDADGALLVRTERGELAFHAGDVIHLRPVADSQ
ncbi:MAG: biotin--[acetyl-CoA-carboxylase] ligase [Ornithinimicrobium sp.]